MVYLMIKLCLSVKNYWTNENIRNKNYNGKILFSMKDFVSLGTDRQSMYFVSTKLLKYKINGVCVPQSQLD